MTTTKYNKYESVLFQIERIKHRIPVELAEEYFIFLTTLYGRRFEEGIVRISDYANMTMFDMSDEIRLRTKMLRADNKRAIEKHKDKQRKEQDKAIQELLQLQ